ncbi:MAG: ribonuclease HII [Candidatus Promineifilaceae bacterium]|jgi:ribonuclease HII
MLAIERGHWRAGLGRVAGVDEAGRGPLAGPVVAAAVVISPDFAEREIIGLLSGLTDSKKLSARQRERYDDILRDSEFVDVAVGSADHDEIDELNVLRATHLAMARALSNLSETVDLALVDGLDVGGLPCASQSIVRGDSLSLSVAAASIIAKEFRDARMREFDLIYPEYEFSRHKGYGTAVHRKALLAHGPCVIHRFSFRPVQDAYAQRQLSL